MARIVQTATLGNDSPLLADVNLRYWIYNGYDVCGTRAIYDALLPEVARVQTSYDFVRAMQGPALDMMLRGIWVNPLQRSRERTRLNAARDRCQALLNELARAVWGRDLNANSNKQLLAFFYTALGAPIQYALRKTPEGKRKTPSCDHKALEALAKWKNKGPAISPWDRHVVSVHLARPFVTLITNIREYTKKLAVVNSGISADGRLRCSYNVVGTVTGRWSSSGNVWGSGTNLQNITESMRRMACADAGYKLGTPDLEQAESRLVAGLTWLATGDDTYWRACESGDLHTIVCTMAYPERFEGVGGWDHASGQFVGDLAACRVIADRKFYRHLSMRDLAKRIGHGSNYFGPPLGIAGMIGIEVAIVEEFQRRYFKAFPAIKAWHADTIRQLQTTSCLITPLGRIRFFFKRTSEETVQREAIAHVPQSTIGELLNCMLYRVWEFGVQGGTVRGRNSQPIRWTVACQLLLQNHDSILFQYPEALEDAVLAKVRERMTLALPLTRTDPDTGLSETRHLALPLEFKTGWNWAKNDMKDKENFDDGNPDGLSAYRGPGSDARHRRDPARPDAAHYLGLPSGFGK